MKEGVRNCTQLYHLTYDCPIVLEVDASQVGVGAYLAQIKDNRKTPVVFLSHVFSDQAQRWQIAEQEAYAIFWAITKLESYLLGTHFCLSTDHKNLVFMDKSDLPKIIRWRLRLQEYDFSVIHIPGKQIVIADCLSHLYYMTLRSNDRTTTDQYGSSFSDVLGESVVRTTDEPQPLNVETENSGVSSNDHESDLANHSIENSGYDDLISSDVQQRILNPYQTVDSNHQNHNQYELNRRLVIDEQLRSSLYDIIRTCHNAIVGHVGIHRLKSMLNTTHKVDEIRTLFRGNLTSLLF